MQFVWEYALAQPSDIQMCMLLKQISKHVDLSSHKSTTN